MTDQDLNRIRGWLLLFLLLLVPHGVGSWVLLLLPDIRAAETALGIATLLVTGAGNLTGFLLIVQRRRITPAFFSLYLPLLLALNLLNPDLVGTANARLAAMGSTGEFAADRIWGAIAVNAVLVVVAVGYWMKSQRVLAVFGSRGIELIVARKRG